MTNVHFRRLRHVALDQHERQYLLALIAYGHLNHLDAPVDVAKLKEKLS